MKKIRGTCWILYLIVFSCTEPAKQLADLFEGNYAKEINGPYSRGKDIITIHREGSVYIIDHRSTYIRLLNGKWQGPETKVDHWTAIYDDEHKILREQKLGKIFSFVPEKKQLLMGTTVYQKQ